METILSGSNLVRPNYSIGAEVVILVVTGVAIILLTSLAGALWTLPVAAFFATSLAAGSWYLYLRQEVLIDATYATTVALGIYILMVYLKYIGEESGGRAVRQAFSRYLAPALVEKLAAHPEQLKLGGELRNMTFMFCDIQGFTSLAEKYKSAPHILTGIMNRFMTVDRCDPRAWRHDR